MNDHAFVTSVADRFGVAFMVRDSSLSQVCTTLLGFMHGRCPETVEQMKAELQGSYANLLVDVNGKLTRAEEERLLGILRRQTL